MTTMTLTLTEFLLTRIAEDETAAYDIDPQWPPRRMLAECEAKRRIVAMHYRAEDQWDPECDGSTDQEGTRWPWWPCQTLRVLAAVYSDHPDWRKEWRP